MTTSFSAQKVFALLLVAVLATAMLLVGCTPPTPPTPPEPEPPNTICSDGFDTQYCSFYDCFDGTEVDRTKWDFQYGDGSMYGNPGWGNNEQQYYREENAYVQDGCLHIVAQKEQFDNKPYTSSKLVTKGLFSQAYGRFEARIRLTKVAQGLWPAFWMMPQDSVYGGWPYSGEIDIMELKGRFPNQSSSAIHFGGKPHTYKYGEIQFENDADYTEFHLYSVDWTEEEIYFSVDGVVFAHFTKDQWWSNRAMDDDNAPFDQEFYMILNFAIGGNFDGGRVPPDEIFPVELVIDYVRVYPLENLPLVDGTEQETPQQ
ncbi:MAG: glycoside hydrolase family 16 protein [Clostridia bacterium]|nr:glycoside hydrolase family 16 protein [Clostridia bacterium]